MANQIQIRRDTFNNWSSNNPVLANGEVGYDTTAKKIKVGDGSTAWLSLADFQAMQDWRDVVHGTSARTAIASTSQFAAPQSAAAVLFSSAAASQAIFYFDPADYAVTGRTTQIRIVSWWQTETAPTSSTLTVNLYPISSTAAGVITLGTIVVGSTSGAITAANTRTALVGAANAAPAIGWYVISFAHSVNPGQTLTYGWKMQVRVTSS